MKVAPMKTWIKVVAALGLWVVTGVLIFGVAVVHWENSEATGLEAMETATVQAAVNLYRFETGELPADAQPGHEPSALNFEAQATHGDKTVVFGRDYLKDIRSSGWLVDATGRVRKAR